MSPSTLRMTGAITRVGRLARTHFNTLTSRPRESSDQPLRWKLYACARSEFRYFFLMTPSQRSSMLRLLEQQHGTSHVSAAPSSHKFSQTPSLQERVHCNCLRHSHTCSASIRKAMQRHHPRRDMQQTSVQPTESECFQASDRSNTKRDSFAWRTWSFESPSMVGTP
jgi:hypothetical protein